MRSASLALIAVLALPAACFADSGEATGPPAPETTLDARTRSEDAGSTLSLVVLGDSVAAGEGIAYGYEYTYDESSPAESHWSGGTAEPRWQGQYQLCHQDERAYGDVVAAALGANLAKFACTGATYLDGITTLQDDGGEQLRPAQFGNWAERSQLNVDYDQARPDVVLLTFGADDVDFEAIVEFCVSGFTESDSVEVDAIAAADDVADAVSDALDGRRASLNGRRTSGERSPGGDAGASYCTEENPGAPIRKLFWDRIDSGEIARHYREMVTSVRERGEDPDHGDGHVPEIVFTTYHRPLPAGLDGDCWDVWPLSPAEQSYLDSLQATLQQVLEEAVGGLDGVHIADVSDALDGHQWCSEDPWAYGLSVYWRDLALQSQAPFHPTPEGQAAIAEVVEHTVRSATG